MTRVVVFWDSQDPRNAGWLARPGDYELAGSRDAPDSELLEELVCALDPGVYSVVVARGDDDTGAATEVAVS